MKIAFINQPQDCVFAGDEQRGSVAIVQWELARQLASRHDVTVYAPLGRGQPLAESWRGIEIRRIPFVAGVIHKSIQLLQSGLMPHRPYFASGLYFREYFAQTSRGLRELAPDVIHVPQQFQFAGMLRQASPSAKIVLHAHQDEIAQLDGRRVLAALRNIDAIVTVSDYVTERLRAAFPGFAERVHTIGNGVDVQRFSPIEEGRNHPTLRRLLFVGRISPDKGVHLLLEAFATLAAECPDLELTLVGKPGFLPFDLLSLLLKDDPALGTLRAFYGHSRVSWFGKVVIGQRSSYRRALLAKLPPDVAARVDFVGTVPLTRLVEIYRSAQLLVLPSVWNESYGLPIAEAMASGVPVLASRCGGVPELVNDGVTGRLVPRCDLDALVGTLRAMLAERDGLRKMGRAGRARAESCLTWERSAGALEQIYARLVAEGRRDRRNGARVPPISIQSSATIAPR